jgi:uncharacterized DUF497 family protein
MNFEWDATKARLNVMKHGVSFEDAITVFDDIFTFDDPDHSDDELRFLTIGLAQSSKLLIVSYPERNNIRIISARELSKRERKFYEERF